jgi:hypothetical protein
MFSQEIKGGFRVLGVFRFFWILLFITTDESRTQGEKGEVVYYFLVS